MGRDGTSGSDDFVRLWTETPMEPRRTRAKKELHAQAQKCQLASESLDPFVREALTEMASYYEHQAERLEQLRQESEREEEDDPQ
jgi:hypothetical protein